MWHRRYSRSATLGVLALLLLPLACNKKGLLFVPKIEPPPSQRLTVTLLPVELGDSIRANPLLLAEIGRSLGRGEDWEGFRKDLASSYASDLAGIIREANSAKDYPSVCCQQVLTAQRFLHE